MARDVFIYWGEKKPTKEEVEKVITNYFGDVATEIKWNDRFFIKLVGTYSFPFAEIMFVQYEMEKHNKDTRWIEVYLGDNYMDIITRQADDLTNHLARGLADVFARYWKGRVEDG